MAVVVEGGVRPCGLLAVGKRRSLSYPRCYRRYDPGYQDDSDPAGVDVAHLEGGGREGVVWF